jgi:molybdopterin-containing oxidoreductase family iron-sulfur binding subunit
MEVLFAADIKLHDGRFAANGWLQELPDPLTKLTWDNAVVISPVTATRFGLTDGDMVKISVSGVDLEMPVYQMPGQAADTVTLALGYGRKIGHPVADGVGFNAYKLRKSTGMQWAQGTVAKCGGSYALSSTQDFHAMDDRGAREMEDRAGEFIREVEAGDWFHDPAHAMHGGHRIPDADLWDPLQYEGDHAWAMSIDLNSCVGCAACTIACQAENNIPVVGKDQIARGRDMHWIRVDRYFTGEPDNPEVRFQPVACQHCENAPCEQVCPVAATTHDDEGLNVMVYNRCIGTRYCSNNCPFKVRRFNFYNFHRDENDVTRMVYNPEVTVRARGVMEKCTFCLQRISLAKITAKNEGRDLRDGDVMPACQQVCPASAIRFGDLKLEGSEVGRLRAGHRAYTMLDELKVKPRVNYLARLRNSGHGDDTEAGEHS